MEDIKRKPGSNGQFYVRYDNKEEAAEIFQWLDERGYFNVQKLTPQNYDFCIICVDSRGCYFGSNITCMAAAASCGFSAISFAELVELESAFEKPFEEYCRDNQVWYNIDHYIGAIRRYLITCSYNYTKMDADERIEHDMKYIREKYVEKESAEYVAIDIGYACG